MHYNSDFLKELDKQKHRVIYVRITALTFEETPIDTIEGRITGGSINIDGVSAIRRTCSLTMVAQDWDYREYLWGLNTKFKLEIGLENSINKDYPDIIWFNQGIYLITTFNSSRSANNFTVNISGKDKMCLLNGEVGGALESSIDFGTIEEEDRFGNWTIRKYPIQEIIRNAVHVYGKEPYWNIIINDLDTYGLELLEYRYDIPLYLYRQEKNNLYDNVIIENDNITLTVNGKPTKLKDLTTEQLDLLVDDFVNSPDEASRVIEVGGKNYIFAKLEYGQTAGYRKTDLVYAGDLIGNIGESVTTILDKIKTMLGEFEYFYDVDGHFVFQKKKSFIETMWAPEADKESVAKVDNNTTAYVFSGSELITTFNNTPNLLNVRNDYSVWGERTGVSGATIPVHLRYAIDNKPLQYTQIDVSDDEAGATIAEYNERYGTTLQQRESAQTFTSSKCDWREVIYQMALDYYKYNMLDDFELRLTKANPEFASGQTGYERYYTDLEGFWRQLYYPTIVDDVEKAQKAKNDCESNIEVLQKKKSALLEKKDLTDQDAKDLADCEANLIAEQASLEELNITLTKLEEKAESYYPTGHIHEYWHKDVYEHPELLNFWFDFLDTTGELSQFSVRKIGARSKAINESSVKSIYFRETPDLIFTDDINESGKLTGYRYIQVPNDMIDEMFSISAQGKSAKGRLDELLYNHGYCSESITINAIPIYHLEPNTRVYVHDEKTHIEGYYVVSKITLPLAYNGTMSITATKAAEDWTG